MANSRSSSESSMSDYDLTKIQEKHRRMKQFLWLLPLLSAFILAIAHIIGYAYLTSNELIEPVWPYSSEFGSIQPYADFYNAFIIIFAFLWLITAYCRYKQISLYLIGGLEKETNNNKHAKKILVKLQKRNLISLICIIIWTLFVIFWCCFRVFEHFYLHIIALWISALFLIIYMSLMCHLSKKLYEYGEIESKPITMIIMTVIFALSVILSIICGFVSASQLNTMDEFLNNKQRIFWHSKINGYDWHLASTIFNWILIVALIPFLCSLSRRMHLFRGWNQIMF